MIDLKALETDPDGFTRALRRRGDVASLDELVRLAKERKETIQSKEKLQVERNTANEAMKKATPEERERNRERLRAIGDEVKGLEAKQREVEEKLDALALVVPNVPRDDVPEGKDEHGNVEVRRVLEPRKIENPKDHVDIATKL